MELTTRCPNCETIFPTSLEQLQLRKGYIRCINCAHIFDGFEAVVPSGAAEARGTSGVTQVEPTIPPLSASAGTESTTHESASPFIPPLRAHEPYASESARASEGWFASEDRRGSEGSPASTRAPEGIRASEPRIPSVVRGRADLPRSGGADFTISGLNPQDAGKRKRQPHGDDRLEGPGAFHLGNEGRESDTTHGIGGRIDEADESALIVEPRTRREHRRQSQAEYLGGGAVRRRSAMTPIWVILSMLGLALLLAQGIYVYRAQLANNFPHLRPVLETACARFGCEVPYERRIEAIAITGSALRSTAASQDGVSSLTLEVTLRNTYERPQEWPTLVLDLKDASGAIVVRRNLPPASWVPAQLSDGPFAAESVLTVHVPVSVRGVQANGYQLDKFFP